MQAVNKFWEDIVAGRSRLECIGVSPHFDRNLLVTDSSGIVPSPYDSDSAIATPRSSLEAGTRATAHAQVATGKRSSGVTRERQTYKVHVSYYGPAFQGWMHQAHLMTVEGALMAALQPLCHPQKAVVAVAGRTDRGVSASGQVCSFYTWHHLLPVEIQGVISAALPGALRCTRVEEVPRSFHATFSAQWRRYVYLFPLDAGQALRHPAASQQPPPTPPTPEAAPHPPSEPSPAADSHPAPSAAEANHSGKRRQWRGMEPPSEAQLQAARRSDPDVGQVHRLLQHLERRPLDYFAFARDTPAGKDCKCTLLAASAREVWLPASLAGAAGSAAVDAAEETARGSNGAVGAATSVQDESAASTGRHAAAAPSHQGVADQGGGGRVRALCVEVVGDRFLRKMVRVLVGTAVREGIPQAARYPGEDDALLRIAAEKDRTATAPPAPASGLCFIEVGY